MSLHRVCCCGEGNCCKCHPVYGGATSWTVTWSGSASVSPGNCACLVASYGAPTTSELQVSTTYTKTSHSYVFDWTNPLDPLTCTVKPVTGSSSFTSTQFVYNAYDIDSSGVCTLASTGIITGATLKVTVAVLPPDCNIPRTNWTVTVDVRTISNVVIWTFTGSTSCTAPGPFTLTNTAVTIANGACFGGDVYSYSAGTVTIT